MKIGFACVTIFLLFISTSVKAQLQSTTIGDAINQGNNCFTITPDLLNQSGGVWFNNPIDFDQDFTIYYQNNFGTKDENGADGMALVFKTTSTPEIGSVGGGMGYQGIPNSMIVEFDTFQNNAAGIGLLGDPPFDHVSIQRDGNPFHTNTIASLTSAVPISNNSLNIEDGIDHEVKIVWEAIAQEFSIFFDCEFVLSLNLDIKTQIFNGDDSVFFGFVGSTGGLSNLHQVCFNSISFVDDLQLQDETICSGESITVNASLPSGASYSWSPTTGVESPNSPVTVISPLTTTTYTITILDNCGESSTEDITITVEDIEDSIFDDYPEFCEGESIPPLPTTSNNGITGSWSPEIDNTQTTTYTFTPNVGECGTVVTLDIIINDLITPTFDDIDPICEGDSLSPLPTISNNGVSGIWTPDLDNNQTTTYTFTPNDNCAEIVTLNIVVNSNIVPEFDTISAICQGETLSPLPTISNNGISGTWSPPLDNTQTTTYTFTPNEGQCSSSTTIQIAVIPITTAIFEEQPAYCNGEDIDPLPTTSENGIDGVWTPEIDNTQTTTYTFTPNDGECAEGSTLTIEIIDTILPEFSIESDYCIGDELPPLPSVSNNGYTGSWSPELNNSVTTTYTFTPDEEQSCVAEITFTINIDPGTLPEFENINPICEGDLLEDLPTISINGISGVWTPEVNAFETTTYSFTPDEGQCAQTTELTVAVNTINEIMLNAVLTSEPFDDTISVQLQVSGGNGVYEYRVNNGPWQLLDTFNNLENNSQYSFEARQVNTCSNIASDIVTGITFPDFFTPNGDGINDYWNIRALRDQSDAVIYIFDRYGKLLEQINPIQIGWDGNYNGRQMPSQDYWFLVEFADELTGNKLSYNNHFTLKR